jgi:hypothetical protein
MSKIHELMIQHTTSNLSEIDENLKKDDLYFKEEENLDPEDKKNKDELLEQRDSTIEFLTKELREKAKLEDSKSSTFMPNENKRSLDLDINSKEENIKKELKTKK